MTYSYYRYCTRLTARGTRCRCSPVHWGQSSLPDPQACGLHLTRAERDDFDRQRTEEKAEHAERVARFLARDPACWSWASPTEEAITETQNRYPTLDARTCRELAMTFWHEGRCAICGLKSERIIDHDHATGLERGELCRSCNTLEGFGYQGIFAKYRERNPATMWGIETPYLDPITHELATPKPEIKRDIWANNPMKGVL